MIQDLYEVFHEGLRYFQAVEEGLIPVGVDIGEDMNFAEITEERVHHIVDEQGPGHLSD